MTSTMIITILSQNSPRKCFKKFKMCPRKADVTLADKDTNSILSDNANRAFQGNVAMKVTQPGGQHWNQCKRRHLTTKF